MHFRNIYWNPRSIRYTNEGIFLITWYLQDENVDISADNPRYSYQVIIFRIRNTLNISHPGGTATVYANWNGRKIVAASHNHCSPSPTRFALHHPGELTPYNGLCFPVSYGLTDVGSSRPDFATRSWKVRLYCRVEICWQEPRREHSSSPLMDALRR